MLNCSSSLASRGREAERVVLAGRQDRGCDDGGHLGGVDQAADPQGAQVRRLGRRHAVARRPLAHRRRQGEQMCFRLA